MKSIEARTGEAGRQRLEGFIAGRYVSSFGVQPPVFAPLLIGIEGDDGRIRAACGLRLAENGFFSERYLDRPAERAATDALGRVVERRQLFEITTIAAVSATGFFRIVTAAVAFGRQRHCRACLFTATAELRALLERRGVVVRRHAPALPMHDDARSWGAYYEHDPWVCIVERSPCERPAPRIAEERAVA